MKRNSRRLLGAMLLGVLVYAGIALYTGYDKVAFELRSYAWETFVLACGLAFSNYLIRFLKWEYYLARLDVRGVRKLDSLLIFLSGFVLTVTPGKVGEVFKSWLLFQTYKIPIARTATIVVAERLTDLIGMIVLILIGSLGFQGGLKWALLGTLVVAACLVVIMSRRLTEVSIRLVERLPGPFRKLGPKIRESWDSLRAMTSPSALLLPTLLSVLAWSLEGLALWMILRGFSAQVRTAPALFFYSTSQLAGALTPLPGGLGVVEGVLKSQLDLLGGVAPAVGTAAMMLARFATLWFAVAVGFSSLGLLRVRHPALSQQVDTDSQG